MTRSWWWPILGLLWLVGVSSIPSELVRAVDSIEADRQQSLAGEVSGVSHHDQPDSKLMNGPDSTISKSALKADSTHQTVDQVSWQPLNGQTFDSTQFELTQLDNGQEWRLLDQPQFLNQSYLKFDLTPLALTVDQSWWLVWDYQLETTESAPGFDQPAFEIYLDEELVYQASADEASCVVGDDICRTPLRHLRLMLNHPAQLPPTTLKFKSQDGGDDQFPTSVKLSQVIVASLGFEAAQEAAQPTSQSQVGQVTDLNWWLDGQHLTLSWSAPLIEADAWLDRGRNYQFRLSPQPLTSDNWSAAASPELILPAQLTPFSPAVNQLALFKIELEPPFYVAIRATDAAGQLGPLAESSQVKVENLTHH